VHAIDAREMTTADRPGPQATPVEDPNGTGGQNELTALWSSMPLGSKLSTTSESSVQEATRQVVTEAGNERTSVTRDDVATAEMKTGVAVVDPVKQHHEHHQETPPERSQTDYQYGD